MNTRFKPSFEGITSALCVGLLLMLPAAFAQSSPPATTFLWQNSAYAFFSSANPTNNCILASVGVQGGFNQQGQNGNSANAQWIEVNIELFDVCNSIVLVSADGSTTNPSVTLDPNLKTGRLVADVPCIDEFNAVPFTAHVDVTFIGAGQISPWTGNYQDNSTPGTKIIVQATGQARDAQATGTVSVADFPAYLYAAQYANSSNLIPQGSFDGALQKMNSATITVTHP